jgi:hypothetical protein
VPLLRPVVTGFSPRRPLFPLRAVRVEFLVDKVALGQVLISPSAFSRQRYTAAPFSPMLSIVWGMDSGFHRDIASLHCNSKSKIGREYSLEHALMFLSLHGQ